MSEALVTPSVLQWARERCDLSLRDLAAVAKVGPEEVGRWESGQSKPSWAQVSKVAQKLKVPLGYLFLEKPPRLASPLPDLRTVDSIEKEDISLDLRQAINDAKLKQTWFREHRIEEGAQRLEFVARYSQESATEEIAADIRKELKLDSLAGKVRASTFESYRKLLTTRAENAGISVLRSSFVQGNTRRTLSVDEFRGFAIIDEFAPLVFINGADAVSAQIFTLIHELSHIWIGVPGISDLSWDPHNRYRLTESLCNAVAAETLVPKDEFESAWRSRPNGPVEEHVRVFSHHFKVSELVMLIRANECQLISADEFSSLYTLLRKRKREKSGSTTGGQFYSSLPYRHGRELSSAILVDTLEGKLSFRDAAAMLNMKPAKIRQAAKEYGIL